MKMFVQIDRRNECGMAVIFVAFMILPLFYLLFTLSSDVGNYYYVRRNSQRILDAAVLFGEKYLPYTEAAHQAVESYLGSQGVLANGMVQVIATADGVSAEYTHGMKLGFAGLLGVEQEIPIYVKSASFSSPLDVFLFIDSSAYMSPDLLEGDTWRSEYSSQSESAINSVFSNYRYGVESEQRLPDLKRAAEQCQNPIYSQHKLAAIQTYEYLEGFGMNRLGVAFYPMSAVEEDVRPLSYSTGTANLQITAGDGQHIKNTDCQLLGEREASLTNEYSTRVFAAPGIVVNTAASAGQAEDDSLSMREVIWYHATRHRNFEGDAQLVPDFTTLTERLSVKLLASSDPLTKRGSLTARAPAVAFIFAGDVPWSRGVRLIDAQGNTHGAVQADVRAALLKLKEYAVSANKSLSVFYILHAHQGNSSFLPVTANDSSSDIDELGAGIAAVDSLFADVNATAVEIANKSGELHLQLVASSDPTVLVSDTATYLAQIKKRAVLSESRVTQPRSVL